LQKSTYKVISAIILALTAVYGVWFVVTGLNLPLFGDEKLGYSSAIHHQAVQGISLLPSATPYDFSFGHPQLHTSIVAFVSRFLGVNPFGFHASQLIVNVVLTMLLLLYWNKNKGEHHQKWLLALFLLVLQPIILTQFYMVNPEFMLAVLFLGVLLSFEKGHFWTCAFIGIASVWTKETGVFSIFIVAYVWFWNKYLFNSGKQIKLIHAILVGISIAGSFLTFMLIQKLELGFYLSPLNLSKTSTSIGAVWFRFMASLKFVFLEQSRIWLSLLLGIWVMIRQTKVTHIEWKYLGLIISFCFFSALLSHPLERYLLFPVVLYSIGLYRLFSKTFHQWQPMAIGLLVFVLNFMNIDPLRKPEYRDVDASYRKELIKEGIN
jgi:hypothetical protein